MSVSASLTYKLVAQGVNGDGADSRTAITRPVIPPSNPCTTSPERWKVKRKSHLRQTFPEIRRVNVSDARDRREANVELTSSSICSRNSGARSSTTADVPKSPLLRSRHPCLFLSRLDILPAIKEKLARVSRRFLPLSSRCSPLFGSS